MEKKLEIIKQEIEKIWFCIYRVSEAKRKKYFYHFKKQDESFIYLFYTFIWLYIVLLIFLLFYHYEDIKTWWDFFSKVFDAFIFSSLMIIAGFTFFLLLWIWHYSLDNSYKISVWIKNKFIIFTDKYFLVNNDFHFYEKLGLENENIKKIFEKEEFDTNLISEERMLGIQSFMNIFNSKQRYVYFLENAFMKIVSISLILKEEQKNLKNIFSENDIFLDFWKIQEKSVKINEIVWEIFIYMEVIQENAKKLKREDFINFEKFHFWLKRNLILPLQNFKNVLEKHLEKIEKILSENKDNNSEQILVLNKRLELQKETLANNILLLDEKIFALENNF